MNSSRKILIIGCIGVGLYSCTASKRMERIIERNPELAQETQTVIIQDTFTDTITIIHEIEPIDTTFKLKDQDTFDFENEDFKLTLTRYNYDDFWLDIMPKPIVIDTVIEKPIYIEKEIPKIIYRKARDALSWKWTLQFLGFILVSYFLIRASK